MTYKCLDFGITIKEIMVSVDRHCAQLIVTNIFFIFKTPDIYKPVEKLRNEMCCLINGGLKARNAIFRVKRLQNLNILLI